MNKHHHVCLGLLADEEHSCAKQVRCGLVAGLGVQILRLTSYEVLVGGPKLAGRELLTSAGAHHETHSGVETSGGYGRHARSPRGLLRRLALSPGGLRFE